MGNLKRKSYVDSSPYQEHSYAFHILKEARLLSREAPFHRDDSLTEEFGFIVPTPPLTSLPKSHQAWDDCAANLPKWFSKGVQREQIAKLDLLSASDLDLPQEYLCRAITIISHLAHAYYLGDYLNGQEAVNELPEALEKPWCTISRRMNRPRVGMTGFESILYNWAIRDSSIPQPRYLENLELLVPVFGNQEERMFNLSFLEVSLAGAPLLSLCIEAQDAVVNKNNDHLAEVLKTLIIQTTELTHAILKMDPVESSENYFDPIIWAKTAPEISKPLRPSEAGLSGGSSPVIHLLDIFLDRLSYKTEMGHQQVERRYWMPRNHQHLLDALGAVSVKDYIAETEDPRLIDLFNQLYEVFSGKKGFFNIHRRKIYTYMELGFKSGRAATNAGSQRDTDEDPWVVVDEDLNDGRKERYQYHYKKSQYCTIKKIKSVGTNTIQLDLNLETGAVFLPGDRCDLYFPNTDDLIDKTLAALGATSTSLVRLSKEWEKYFAENWPEYAHDVVLLRDFLQFAKIRPVDRDIMVNFYNITHAQLIKDILDEHNEDQFELWDFLEAIKPYYDVRQLWEISPWQRENITRILPPNQPRIYSITSGSLRSENYYSDHVSLTITKFFYDTNYGGVSIHRAGVATKFLSQEDVIGKKLRIEFESPSFFDFMKGLQNPMFLFAGGSAISSFMSLFEYLKQVERTFQPYLFYSCASYDDFLHKEFLLELSMQKKIKLYVVFTRIENDDLTKEQKIILEKALANYRCDEHIDELIREDKIADLISHHIILEKKHKEAGYVYISSKTFFYKVVLETIEEIVNKKMANKNGYSKELIDRLYAEKRLQSEVFTEYTDLKTNINDEVVYIPVSKVIEYNNKKNGYWMIINDIVYDITDYIYRHPGGNKILKANCGLDGTKSYKNVEHHLWPEIESLLNAYQIGLVKPIKLKKNTEIGLINKKFQPVSEMTLYNHALQAVYRVVSMENTLHNSYEIPVQKSDLNCMIVYDVHRLIGSEFLPDFMGNFVFSLWNLSSALYKKDEKFIHIHEQTNKLIERVVKAPVNINSLIENDDLDLVIQRLIKLDFELLYDLKLSMKSVLVVLEQQKDAMLILDEILKIHRICSDYSKDVCELYRI